MSLKEEKLVEEEIKEKVNNLGFEIEYVEDIIEGGKNIIRIVLDKDGIVSIDDCELVSRTIEDDIDKLIKKEYVLEVSSPGLERQLKNIRLYKKYTGKEIFVKLFKKIDGKKEFIGILESVDEENSIISIKVDGKVININVAEISSAHTTFDFDSSIKQSKVNLNELKKF